MNTKLLRPTELSAKVLILPFFEDKKEMTSVQNELNGKFNNLIQENILKNFEGKLNETLVFPTPEGYKVVALGLGKYEELTMENARIRSEIEAKKLI